MKEGTHLSLQNIDLAILDVHVILDFCQFSVHAIALLLRLHCRLRFLLDHPVLLLESLSHLLDLHISERSDKKEMTGLRTGRREKSPGESKSWIFSAQYVLRTYTRRNTKRHKWGRKEEEKRREKLDPILHDSLAFLSSSMASSENTWFAVVLTELLAIRLICQTNVIVISRRRYLTHLGRTLLEEFFQKLKNLWSVYAFFPSLSLLW